MKIQLVCLDCAGKDLSKEKRVPQTSIQACVVTHGPEDQKRAGEIMQEIGSLVLCDHITELFEAHYPKKEEI